MALNFFPLLLFTILSLALLVNFSTAALGGGRNSVRSIPGSWERVENPNDLIVGGWERVENPNDPIVVAIGAFAVNEHNKEANERLGFQKVLNGEMEVVAGMNYKLVIAATRGGGTQPSKYEVVVMDVPWKHLRQLISFKKLS